MEIQTAGTKKTYAADKMKSPGSLRYHYECWFFIDSNQPQGEEHALIYRKPTFALTLNGTILSVFCNPASEPSTRGLFTPSTVTPATETKITLTHAFPFQKWTQFVMNVDGSTVDLYLDGKLVSSKTLTSPMSVVKTEPVCAGNDWTKGKLKMFSYFPRNIDPQTVWNNYAKQMGMAGISDFFGAYKIDMSLLRNNEKEYTFGLL